jgi:hypothetical protein
MQSDPVQSLRLAFKRAFASYFLSLQSPEIADPTEAFEAASEYLTLLHGHLGMAEFMRRLDDDTTHMAGQIEQDLRYKLRGRDYVPASDDIEDRLRECFEHGLSQLPPAAPPRRRRPRGPAPLDV